MQQIDLVCIILPQLSTFTILDGPALLPLVTLTQTGHEARVCHLSLVDNLRTGCPESGIEGLEKVVEHLFPDKALTVSPKCPCIGA